MDRCLTPTQQGDLGEAEAIATLARLGGNVSVPLFSSGDYDLVVDFGSGVLRVQVKTSRCRRGDRYVVQIATHGGNQSWSGTVKHFDANRCDLLFALLADGRRFLIPADAVQARVGLTLGGAKYSEFEIEQNRTRHLTAEPPPLECSAGGGAPELESRARL